MIVSSWDVFSVLTEILTDSKLTFFFFYMAWKLHTSEFQKDFKGIVLQGGRDKLVWFVVIGGEWFCVINRPALRYGDLIIYEYSLT